MSTNCSNCKFFEERTNFCRRFPPTVTMSEFTISNSDSNNHVVAYFPKIGKKDVDWCGEHKSKTIS